MTQQADGLFIRLGKFITSILEKESAGYEPYTPSDPETLYRTLQPGDILLVEGNRKVSAAIKYLTQSTWSHAALYVGDALDTKSINGEPNRLIEVNAGSGCTAEPLEKYQRFNTRICRAAGLTPKDREVIISFMVSKLGTQYDTRNLIDLARYLLPLPPVPVSWRRRMIQFGSGDPTRAICSTLIAQAFQKIQYPILPEITAAPGRARATSDYSRREILHIRHYSLYTPRDFDLSPYFSVVKPTLEFGFDYKRLIWSHDEDDADDADTQSSNVAEMPQA